MERMEFFAFMEAVRRIYPAKNKVLGRRSIGSLVDMRNELERNGLNIFDMENALKEYEKDS